MVDWIFVFCQLTSKPRNWALSFSTNQHKQKNLKLFSEKSDVVGVTEISKGLSAQRRAQKPSVRSALKDPIYREKK